MQAAAIHDRREIRAVPKGEIVTDKILSKLKSQVAITEDAGSYCVFTKAEGQQLLDLINAQHAEFVRMENSWRREIDRIRDEYQDEGEYDLDKDYGTPEDRDCAYWERVFRERE
jgi:hypothetical protein